MIYPKRNNSLKQKEVEPMKNKIWMTVLALFCLGVGLLSGGCAAPQASQRSELKPLVGGASEFPSEFPGDNKNFWPHPGVMP